MSFSIFSDGAQSQPKEPSGEITNKEKCWNVLIIDDEEDIHSVTKLVLTGFELNEMKIRFHHAYSASEAFEFLKNNKDIAVALVDVVMETNDAGLKLVERIRGELDNHKIRLILRTGQPGEAPEESVIRDYDINDYKNKSELTAIKLKTLMYASVRSYRDLCIIDESKKGLERIVSATVSFMEADSLKDFASIILAQLAKVLGLEESAIYCCAATNEAQKKGTEFDIIAATGREFGPKVDSDYALPDEIVSLFAQAHNERAAIHGEDYFVGYFTTRCGLENLLYVNKSAKLMAHDHQILQHYANNIAVAHDNLSLREVIRESQKELSYILGEAVEKRSKETGSHVKRVANFSYILATLYGLPPFEAEKIKMASPLHDVGKIAIPDAILNKPAKLDKDEWEIMKTHASQGQEMLLKSRNEILQLGAKIAGQHHEKWDGSGYPLGLKGEDIHISGRITAIADVFDALASERCYKPAWPMEKVINLLKEERGKHFEPKLVDLLLDNLEQFTAIRDLFPDKNDPDVLARQSTA